MLSATGCWATRSACHTPELIEHGVSGPLSESEAEAVAAVRRLGSLNRTGVCAYAECCFIACMVHAYLAAYQAMLLELQGSPVL